MNNQTPFDELNAMKKQAETMLATFLRLRQRLSQARRLTIFSTAVAESRLENLIEDIEIILSDITREG